MGAGCPERWWNLLLGRYLGLSGPLLCDLLKMNLLWQGVGLDVWRSLLTPAVLWFCGDGCGWVTVLGWIQLALWLVAVCLLQQAKLRNNDVISAEMTCMTFGHLFCKVVVSRYLFLTVLGSWWIHKGLASSYWSSHTEVSSGEMLPGKGSQHERVGSPYSWLRWLFWGARGVLFSLWHSPAFSEHLWWLRLPCVKALCSNPKQRLFAAHWRAICPCCALSDISLWDC